MALGQDFPIYPRWHKLCTICCLDTFEFKQRLMQLVALSFFHFPKVHSYINSCIKLHSFSIHSLFRVVARNSKLSALLNICFASSWKKAVKRQLTSCVGVVPPMDVFTLELRVAGYFWANWLRWKSGGTGDQLHFPPGSPSRVANRLGSNLSNGVFEDALRRQWHTGPGPIRAVRSDGSGSPLTPFARTFASWVPYHWPSRRSWWEHHIIPYWMILNVLATHGNLGNIQIRSFFFIVGLEGRKANTACKSESVEFG